MFESRFLLFGTRFLHNRRIQGRRVAFVRVYGTLGFDGMRPPMSWVSRTETRKITVATRRPQLLLGPSFARAGVLDVFNQYRVWTHPGRKKIRKGDRRALLGFLARAKSLQDHEPLEFVNEYISRELALAIRLPVPPVAMVRRKGVEWHASLDCSISDDELPPINPNEVISHDKGLACGITLFDIWIANDDRKRCDAGFDREKKVVQIFDHGEALLSGSDPMSRLAQIEESDDIGIGRHHIFARELNTLSPMGTWNDRIQQIPEQFIASISQEAVQLGLNANQAEFVVGFLCRRRKLLRRLLLKNLDYFPKRNKLFADDLDWNKARVMIQQRSRGRRRTGQRRARRRLP